MAAVSSQINNAPGDEPAIESFASCLEKNALSLTRGETCVLQVNIGLECNQVCTHCHLDAGPSRSESMSRKTVDDVIGCAKQFEFRVIDITGGAPELNPNLSYMIEAVAPLAPEVILRSNSTLLADKKFEHIVDMCAEHSVVITTSLPSVNRNQAEIQRGKDVFDHIVRGLALLNSKGYGQPGSGLKLNIVSNPTGSFLPQPQAQAEKRFRQELARRRGVVFTNLFTFANAPLGRFRQWLILSGNYRTYMKRLAASFNKCTTEGLMCRTLISVSWDGFLYDCDFNQASGLFIGGRKMHVSELQSLPAPGTPIAVGDHCYCCTAGSGFT